MTNSETETVHGNAGAVFGIGLLLIGPSGVGKTECALELVRRGHQFVADDRVVISSRNGSAYAAGKSGWQGQAHVRDLGVIAIGELFGPESVVQDIELCAVIELRTSGAPEPTDEAQNGTFAVAGVALPLFRIHNAGGRAALLIELIARTLTKKSHGHAKA